MPPRIFRLVPIARSCLFLAGCLAAGIIAAAEPPASDEDLVIRVARKYFAAAVDLKLAPIDGWAWPPLVGIAHTDDINAFADMDELRPGEKPTFKDYPEVRWLDLTDNDFPADAQPSGASPRPIDDRDEARSQPYIVILQGFLDKIVKGEEIILAETFGHELGHLIHKHHDIYNPGSPPLVTDAVRREAEAQADVTGMKLSMANYPYNDIVKAVLAWRNWDAKEVAEGKRPDYSAIRTLLSDHPGWTERAGLIAQKQPELWRSLGAFEAGVYFLMAENYLLAEKCFTQVVKEMPKCYEAWANRGYCRLMRYCDLLNSDNLKEFDLNHVVVGGFYHQAGSIDQRDLGGIDEELWFAAVGDLNEALRIKESLILPKANLALAYLVHPAGKQPGRAVELFEQVIAALKRGNLDEEISPADYAGLLVNAGVSELMNGDAQSAQRLFDDSEAVYAQKLKSRPIGPVKSAILYSTAARRAASADAQERKLAARELEEYLTDTNPSVTWWNLAFERYQELCQSEKLEGKSKDVLAKRVNLHFRPVVGLTLANGMFVTLNDPLEDLTKALGQGNIIPLVKRASVHRRIYYDQGVEFICSDRVIGIRLREANSPALTLTTSGPGGKTLDVRIGMTLNELLEKLGGDGAWKKRYGTQEGLVYHYFDLLGFGVRVNDADKITEILVAQLSHKADVK
ncbi:MAG: hypothetical protein U0872_06140 [Planctomycetaceae bacterium]